VAKTRDIRRRIRSIGNTMQLTRAMKMVSAAKLRRAQERIVRARPYSERMHRVLQSLALRADPENHPLLQVHGDRRVELLVVTADKGLCGGFNAGICRAAEAFLARHEDRELVLSVVGKKGRDYFVRRRRAPRAEWIQVFRRMDFPLAAEVARDLMARYLARDVDEIHVAYNEFKSAIQQRPVVERVLPIPKAELRGAPSVEDYLYEPEPRELFARLIPHHVEMHLYRAILESAAAEHAARMTAMDSATSNAGELIESLTLTMNRVRQASITTEIIEVVSGAQALG
jgi:F-type H+-transporting ATPase subunit gamma